MLSDHGEGVLRRRAGVLDGTHACLHRPADRLVVEGVHRAGQPQVDGAATGARIYSRVEVTWVGWSLTDRNPPLAANLIEPAPVRAPCGPLRWCRRSACRFRFRAGRSARVACRRGRFGRIDLHGRNFRRAQAHPRRATVQELVGRIVRKAEELITGRVRAGKYVRAGQQASVDSGHNPA